MNYQAIGAMLFPFYCWLSALAVIANITSKQALVLASGIVMQSILLFQFLFDGQAKIYQWRWYLLVSGVHLFIILLAWLSEVRVSKVLMLLAGLAITLNLVYLPFYVIGHPLPRQGYFIGMNSLITAQLGSLVVLGPLWPFLGGLWRKLAYKKEPPWTLRVLSLE